MSDVSGRRGLMPLLLSSAVVVLVAIGLGRGLWPANLHNALLALAFTAVGVHVLHQTPAHRGGRLFLATGIVQSVLFLGRQVGHTPDGDGLGVRWIGWLGVWPVGVALTLTTLAVLTYPDGRLPTSRWRPVAAAVVGVGVLCALLSALWPVEYAATGVTTSHPWQATAPGLVSGLWAGVAHPAYAAFQLLWVWAVVARWRRATGHVRRQLAALAAAAAGSVVALLVGLVVSGSPRAGLLSAALVPVVAGWAIVHGQQAAARTALTWLSRSGDLVDDVPGDFARAVATALEVRRATLWLGEPHRLRAVGVWPDDPHPGGRRDRPTSLAGLEAAPHHVVRPVVTGGERTGALSVELIEGEPLSRSKSRLLDELAAQAGLVVGHLSLAEIVGRQRRAGQLDTLTPREREVLTLMARGLTNAAICQELHLSVKTVEPVVSSVFAKLGLHADPGSNRRVLAVLEFVRD